MLDPLFLVGAERSGSTLLRLMLDHHPEIAFEHEFDEAVALVSDDGQFPEVEAYVEWLGSVRGMRYSIDRSLAYRDLVEDFLRQKKLASGDKRFIGATVHHHFDRLPFVWPDARYMHLIRDPRDVALSVLQKGWAGNLYHAADWWTEAERCWDSLAARVPAERTMEVRYEVLVTNPEQQLTRVCQFIGVPFDRRMLDYEQSARQYPKPDPKLALQWRTKLTPRQIGVVELRTGDMLEAKGYEPSGHATPEISALKHELLMLDSRVRRLFSRAEQLGPGLIALDFLARRLGLRTLARQTHERINAAEERLIEQEAAGVRAPSANIAPASNPTSTRTK